MDDLTRLVGERLRAARRERGLSLDSLAKAAAIGKGSLSEIENGLRNPTLSTLYALAGALSVPLAELLAGQAGTTVASPGIEARLLDASHSGGCTVEVYRLHLSPGQEHHSGPHGPGVTEHLLITAGRARAGPLGSQAEIGTGESAQWVSDVPHGYAALGDEPAESVLVIRSPHGPASPDPPGGRGA